MSHLFKIVYAAHANGTHHKLALDALRHLESAEAEKWTRLFLKYADVYLQGSKAPDTEFKDFKNHVLHVRDGYWGGAPEKAQSWYTHVVEGLQAGDWERAVYAAGVLSHYITDPIHPFHTAQSEAENNIHRACEWSINRSYDSLRKEAERSNAGVMIAVPEGANWLKELVCQSAAVANKSYEKLIAHYDIHRGAVAPTEGLDAIARAAVAPLLMIAAKTVASVLDRAFADAGVPPPEVALTAETFLAALKVPLKFVTKKIEDAETRRLVEAMYDELRATGRVEVNLPEDDRMVRDLFAAEVLAPRAAADSVIRDQRLAATAQMRPPVAPPSGKRPAAPAASAIAGQPTTSLLRTNESKPPLVEPVPMRTGLSQLSKAPRVALTPKDLLEAAPTIGPKMAERFAAIGIVTVGDFIGQDAGTMAELLADRRFTGDTLTTWQHQARMVMAVPGMTGTQAQLFTGAGLTTAADIAAADPVQLSSSILAYAAGPDGRRILRDGNPPELEKIRSLVTQAAAQMAA